MKRITFFIATLCLLLVNVNAQTIENIAQLNSNLYSFIPKEFSADGNAVPMLRLGENKIVILNEDFSLGREIADAEISYYYVEFLNLDESGYVSDIPFTQTLFNNDDKVEFIRVIGELNQWGEITNIEGCKIVNEDNEVLFTIEETSANICVLRWKGMYYLTFTYYDDNDQEVMNVYAINKDGNDSSISKVKTMSCLKAFPALANRNSVVDVTIDEASATEGGELVIVDNGGRVVAKQPFEPGQTTVPVCTSRMRTGVYNITLNNGAKVENARIIVK
jgi:hypothetical protein